MAQQRSFLWLWLACCSLSGLPSLRAGGQDVILQAAGDVLGSEHFAFGRASMPEGLSGPALETLKSWDGEMGGTFGPDGPTITSMSTIVWYFASRTGVREFLPARACAAIAMGRPIRRNSTSAWAPIAMPTFAPTPPAICTSPKRSRGGFANCIAATTASGGSPLSPAAAKRCPSRASRFPRSK